MFIIQIVPMGKALEAVNNVTLQVKVDSRGDDDDILQVADDSGGSPDTWGTSVDMGNFTEDESKPFWIRANPGGTEEIGKRACKIEVSVA